LVGQIGRPPKGSGGGAKRQLKFTEHRHTVTFMKQVEKIYTKVNQNIFASRNGKPKPGLHKKSYADAVTDPVQKVDELKQKVKQKKAQGGMTSSSSPQKQKKAICWSFRDTGACKFGKDCHFEHVEKAGGAGGGGKKGECWRFRDTGSCHFGKNCHFEHVAKAGGAGGGGKKGECWRFRDTGSCHFGDDCHFEHVVKVDAAGGGGKQGVCWRFRDTGSCHFGKNCKYDHVEPAGGGHGGSCQQWNKLAWCPFGDNCELSHATVCASFMKGNCSKKPCNLLHPTERV
jgi:hypothetical protein